MREEQQYIDLINDILKTGDVKDDRTGVGTLSKFGCHMRFSLENNVIPLLTTKRIHWRAVCEELLWFISGSTNSKKLSDKGIKIWDANGSRDFLDKNNLHNREEGDLGPVYGFQWRHFGAKYADMHADYTGKGVDQLANLIKEISTNPSSRRLILNAWNPTDLQLMALPPCHIVAQFSVTNGKLSCALYQRSCDVGLGVPFNIASYSLLTHMIAHITNLKAGDFIYFMGDTHIYKNHVESLKMQAERIPRPFPTVKINREITSIDDFKFEDFTLIDYNPHNSIQLSMAI